MTWNEDYATDEFDFMLILLTCPVGAGSEAVASLLNLPFEFHFVLVILTFWCSAETMKNKSHNKCLVLPPALTLLAGAYHQYHGILSVATFVETCLFAILAAVIYLPRHRLDDLWVWWQWV